MKSIIYAKNPFHTLLIGTMLVLLILVLAMATSAQSPENGAGSIRPTQNVAVQSITAAVATDDDLKNCAQMLDKSMNEASACAAHAATLEKLLTKSSELQKKTEELADERLKTIFSQAKTIETLTQIKCSTDSWFWGIKKKKTCY